MFKKHSVNIMEAYASKCEIIGRRVFFSFFKTQLLILWGAKFIYVNLIYGKVIVVDKTDKLCGHHPHCACVHGLITMCSTALVLCISPFIWKNLLSAIQNENIFLCK